MTDEITTQRESLATLITNAVDFTVDPYAPPKGGGKGFGFIIPGGPWLTDGNTFGTFTHNLEVHLAFSAMNNKTTTERANAQVVNAVVAIVLAKWSVTEVSEPFELSMNGTNFMAVRLLVNRAIQL